MAVYTKITDEQAIDVLAHYDIGDFKSLSPIESGITNSNYILTTTNGPFILTIFEDIRNSQSCPDTAREVQNISVEYMAHLHKNGLIVPEPQVSRHGNKQFTCFHGQKYGAIFSFLSGSVLQTEALTTAHCQDLGICLARMHNAARSFDGSKENPLGHHKWQALFDKMSAKIPAFEEDTNQINVAETIQNAITDINDAWPQNLPQGMVHGDLFPDNVLFENNKISGILDLHDVCTDAFAYDLGICINAWCFTDDGDDIIYHPAKARAIITGYNQLSAISDTSEIHFPLICQAAAMRFLLTRLYDYLHPIEGAVVTLKNPTQYLKRLAFHQKMPELNAYLNGVA